MMVAGLRVSGDCTRVGLQECNDQPVRRTAIAVPASTSDNAELGDERSDPHPGNALNTARRGRRQTSCRWSTTSSGNWRPGSWLVRSPARPCSRRRWFTKHTCGSLAARVPIRWESRAHFFAAAAEAMRRILVDMARRKHSDRHGGRWQRCEILDGDLAIEYDSDDLLDLDEALARLNAIDERAAELVKLRVFAGMTIDEVAAYQGVSPRTAKRSWAYARAWLVREMKPSRDADQT